MPGGKECQIEHFQTITSQQKIQNVKTRTDDLAVGRVKDTALWLPLQELNWLPAISKTPISTEEPLAMPLMNSFNLSCIRMKVFLRVEISKTERAQDRKRMLSIGTGNITYMSLVRSNYHRECRIGTGMSPIVANLSNQKEWKNPWDASLRREKTFNPYRKNNCAGPTSSWRMGNQFKANEPHWFVWHPKIVKVRLIDCPNQGIHRMRDIYH